MDHDAELADVLNDENCFCNFAYLAYMPSKMDEINLSLQGKPVTIFKATVKCLILKENLCIGWSVFERNMSIAFLLMKRLTKENNIQHQDKIQKKKFKISRNFT